MVRSHLGHLLRRAEVFPYRPGWPEPQVRRWIIIDRDEHPPGAGTATNGAGQHPRHRPRNRDRRAIAQALWPAIRCHTLLRREPRVIPRTEFLAASRSSDRFGGHPMRPMLLLALQSFLFLAALAIPIASSRGQEAKSRRRMRAAPRPAARPPTRSSTSWSRRTIESGPRRSCHPSRPMTKLTRAARDHARDMADHKNLSHEGSDGSDSREADQASRLCLQGNGRERRRGPRDGRRGHAHLDREPAPSREHPGRLHRDGRRRRRRAPTDGITGASTSDGPYRRWTRRKSRGHDRRAEQGPRGCEEAPAQGGHSARTRRRPVRERGRNAQDPRG